MSRRAAKRMKFSDLTLLRALDARARPKARLREVLLMAARCALLAALIVAAAAPARRGDAAAAGEGLDLVILLDASYSMRARDGVRVRFDAARDAGRRLLKLLGPSDRVAVGVFDEALKSPLALGSAEAADAALASARPGWRGTDTASAMLKAGELLDKSAKGRHRAVVVLGDGAAHGLRGAAPVDGAAVLGLAFPALPNAWISSIKPAPGSSARAPRLEVTLGAAGEAASTPLDLWVGERRAGSSAASAPAGGEGARAWRCRTRRRPTRRRGRDAWRRGPTRWRKTTSRITR
ncbi:MAG: VWA domain-containing protein [Elusimicrobiota bacterium]|nr:MAG: VWA domain-containing protein [Elusimicrobiota bacterium]